MARYNLMEKRIRGLVHEAVKSVLNEGIKSDYLQRMIKRHGGLRSLNKELMLDKNDYRDYWFFDNGIDWRLKKFVIPVMTLNDDSEIVIENPKYADDPVRGQKVQDMLNQYGELIDARSAGFSGHSYEEDEYERDDDGTGKLRKSTRYASPNDERLAAHRKSRGVKTRGVHKTDDSDYQKYVDNYVRRLAGEYGMETLHDMGGKEYYHLPCDWDNPERQEIERLFGKYGYGNHEYHSPLYDDNERRVVVNVGDLLLAPDAISYFEGGRNPYTGSVDFIPKRHKLNPPRIGTSEFLRM